VTRQAGAHAGTSEEENTMSKRIPGWVGAIAAALALGHSAAAGAQTLPTLDFVIVDNLGHLPMMVGVEKGLFKQHGVDVRLKIVKSGTEIVNALKKNEVQGGNMSVTTFIKGRQGGEPVTVFALAMNDATRANADDPLAIIARKDSGIKPGDLKTLKGKKVGVWFEQTPDEYLKIALDKAGLKKGEVELVNITSNPALVPNLAEAKVDAVVSLEPWNTLILDKVPGSYLVKRGGGYMSYMMVSTFQDSLLKSNPDLARKFAEGLAAASYATRQNRDEAIEIFAKVVPGVDVATAKKAVRHISYDPRISAASMSAFDAAQNALIRLGSGSADKKLDLKQVVVVSYMRDVEKSHPQYFKDLKKVN
jgi:ABC-type nitrate/sulfonate/bicarbonate transport system substrate-binding protein